MSIPDRMFATVYCSTILHFVQQSNGYCIVHPLKKLLGHILDVASATLAPHSAFPVHSFDYQWFKLSFTLAYVTFTSNM